MSERIKIKILETKFNEKEKLMSWLCLCPDEIKRTFIFSVNDIKAMVNTNLDIPDELIKKFCKDMEGQERYIIINGDINKDNVKTMPLEEQNSILDKYYNILPDFDEQ